MAEKKVTGLRLSEETLKILDELCTIYGTDRSDLVSRALATYMHMYDVNAADCNNLGEYSTFNFKNVEFLFKFGL